MQVLLNADFVAVTIDVRKVVVSSPGVGYALIFPFRLLEGNLSEATSDGIMVPSRVDNHKSDVIHIEGSAFY
jgi:hypothetical protein